MEIKKAKQQNLESRRLTFLLLGLALSTAFALTAFEWKTTVKTPHYNPENIPWIETDKIPNTIKEKPPKPQVLKRRIGIAIKKVDNNSQKDDGILLIGEWNTELLSLIDTSSTEVKEDPAPFIPFPAHAAEFIGDLNRYLVEHTVYPREAADMGDEGTVYVYFEVNTDGSIGHVKLLRGISPALDSTALQIVRSMPPWKAAYQIPGQAVRSPMRLPIRFTLH